MMAFWAPLRIIMVWTISICIVCYFLADNRRDGFILMLIVFGIILTIPALILLGIAFVADSILLDKGQVAAAFAVGPLIGLAVPLIMFAVVANDIDPVSKVVFYFKISMLTGILWSGSLSVQWLAYRREAHR